MKRILFFCIGLLLAFSGLASAEWLVCDGAPENVDTDPDNDIAFVVVVQDGATIIRNYELHSDGVHVLVADTSMLAQAHFEVSFENVQGRRSDPVSYDLKPKPSGCSGLRILN